MDLVKALEEAEKDREDLRNKLRKLKTEAWQNYDYELNRLRRELRTERELTAELTRSVARLKGQLNEIGRQLEMEDE